MKNNAKYFLTGTVVVLIICIIAASFFTRERYVVKNDAAEVKAEAESLYNEGKLDEAIVRMETYCNNIVTDTEAKIMLGDWYLESGDVDSAVEKYNEAAKTRQFEEKDYTYLSPKHTQAVMTDPIQEIYMEITPEIRRTKDMTLMITGHNLFSEVSVPGRINLDTFELTEAERFYTTEWFGVDPDGKYITMSGGFNCAIWQFVDKDGIILATAESPNRYRENGTYQVNVYQMARVQIPEKAVSCRVTYFDKEKESVTASVDEKLTLVYGRLPGESKEADISYYEIPDIEEGEKIVFDGEKWLFVGKGGEEIQYDWDLPTIEKGSYITIGGTLPGRVSFEKSTYAAYEKDGIYTVRFDLNNPSATGERLDDAKNLGFNAKISSGNFTVGENHFDNIYPWSEMKVCTIRDGRIIYSGEEGFSNSGMDGDVFVEIPKFYVRRVNDGKFDTISISGEKHEGFEVDEAFVTKEGEVDKIYIASYFTGIDETGINSGADFTPVMGISRADLLEKIAQKGDGYREIDYAALSCVQKLFMVETGIRNSQYIFMGICAYSLPSPVREEVSVALTDRTKTNCIEVSDVHTFIEGNNIILFDMDNYVESVNDAINDVKKITTVIDNFDGTQSVFFSGDPVEIYKDRTAIAHTVIANGTSGSVEGHTGAVSTGRGTVSFKYRNIENLWGNMYVYIDSVEVMGDTVTITDRKGKRSTLSYKLPTGRVVNDAMITKLGYDPRYPQIMLPYEVSSEATISTYYGDAYIDWNTIGEVNYLYHGGAWNNGATAGLFSFMTGTGDGRLTATGRMMYIPEN